MCHEINRMTQEVLSAWPGLVRKELMAVSIGRSPGHVGGAWMHLGRGKDARGPPGKVPIVL